MKKLLLGTLVSAFIVTGCDTVVSSEQLILNKSGKTLQMRTKLKPCCGEVFIPNFNNSTLVDSMHFDSLTFMTTLFISLPNEESILIQEFRDYANSKKYNPSFSNLVHDSNLEISIDGHTLHKDYTKEPNWRYEAKGRQLNQKWYFEIYPQDITP